MAKTFDEYMKEYIERGKVEGRAEGEIRGKIDNSYSMFKNGYISKEVFIINMTNINNEYNLSPITIRDILTNIGVEDDIINLF